MSADFYWITWHYISQSWLWEPQTTYIAALLYLYSGESLGDQTHIPEAGRHPAGTQRPGVLYPDIQLRHRSHQRKFRWNMRNMGHSVRGFIVHLASPASTIKFTWNAPPKWDPIFSLPQLHLRAGFPPILSKGETESLGTWAMNGPIVYHPWMKDEYGTLVEW